MAQILLIDRTDIAEFKQISDTVYDKVLNMHILDAQFSDIQRLMGVNFYNDLIRNYTESNYQTLLNGGTYTYNGINYTNVGLKAVLVHYTYARYILNGTHTDTPFGFVDKLNENSEKVDLANRKIISKMNEQMGYSYWENVQDFLEKNASNYPLYVSNCATKNTGFRISKIG
jgi:hypothetical protein